MPTRFSARAGLLTAMLLAACAATGAPVTHRVITLPAPARTQVRVAIDPTLIDPAGEHRVKLLGSQGRLALVLDSYASRPQSMSRCQAGSERYVRVIDVTAKAERYAKLVESCLRNVVPGDPPATWASGGSSVIIHLVSEPSVSVSVDARGRVGPERPTA